MATAAPTPADVRRPKFVSPAQFFLVGVSLFLIKFVIDRLIARAAFGREWSLRSYLIPEQAYSVGSLQSQDQWFFLAMLGVAVPFVIAGLVMTVRRLRDAGLSLWLAALFFVPFVNLLFFGILSLLPSLPVAAVAVASGEAPSASRENTARVSLLDRLMPLSDGASFLVASLFVFPLGPMTVGLGVFVFRNYGWGLFVGLPFLAGLLATVLHTHRARRSFWSCALVSILALSMCGFGIFLCAMEGAVCLLMLFPLAIPIALAGAAVGYSIQRRPLPAAARGFPVELMGLLLLLPLLMGAERLVMPEAQVFSATTSVDIDAPPEAVWRNVVSFSEIPPPKDWFFATGVAYPIRARIEGTGVGACRYCEFSTGPFIEPITAWEEPRLLKFDVTHNPPPMREWGPFDIHPPHLENYPPVPRRPVSPDRPPGWPDTPGRNDVVSAPHVPGGLLATMGRLRDPQDSPESVGARERAERGKGRRMKAKGGRPNEAERPTVNVERPTSNQEVRPSSTSDVGRWIFVFPLSALSV